MKQIILVLFGWWFIAASPAFHPVSHQNGVGQVIVHYSISPIYSTKTECEFALNLYNSKIEHFLELQTAGKMKEWGWENVTTRELQEAKGFLEKDCHQ